MELSIQKWGNSAAVRLTATLLEQLKVALGDKLSVDVRPDGVMLKPARRKYSLDELIAQCDAKAPMPDGLADWSGAKPVGCEVW
jgi:antitoxin ChpS